MSGYSTGHITIFLAAICPQISSCTESTPQQNARPMVGVLSIGNHEGESFQECSLDEPWYCFRSEEPPCAFNALDEARSIVGAALEKAGIATVGSGDFGVELTGFKVDTKGSGHMGAYSCEITAISIQSIREVEFHPPDTNPL